MTDARLRSFPVALWLILGASSLGAQIPEKFTNLKVIPSDVPAQQLTRTMVAFSRELGVRCVYCHVGEDSPTLQGVDFASDEKTPKKTARIMIALTQSINARLSAELGPAADGQDRVRCMTCHRGAAKPELPAR
jgi:hypothetical protein